MRMKGTGAGRITLRWSGLVVEYLFTFGSHGLPFVLVEEYHLKNID